MTSLGRMLAVGVAVLLVGTACGGGSDEVADSTSTTLTAQAGSTAPQTTAGQAATDPGAADDVLVVGRSTVFRGFRYDVVDARLGESFGTPVVSVSIDIENLGDEAGRPPSVLSLQTSDGVIDNSGFGVTSNLEPGAIENGVYEFQVGAGFSFEDSVLLIGRAGSAQAFLPLSGGAVVSLEAVETVIDQVGTAAGVEIHLDRAVVDWHSLAVFGESADAGTAYLTAIVDITLGDKSRTAKDTFELVLPNGETVGPERAPNEVLEVGETAAGLEVVFIVSEPLAGDYLLRLLNLSRFPEDVVAEIPFVLGA